MYSGQDGNNVVGPGGVGAGSGAPISSGQGMMPNRPIASGGGDIVLNNSGDQKSKKGLKWAIGIIVGVLILIGVGVGVWFFIFGNNFGSVVSNENINSLFNRYANYLLYGSDSNGDIPNGAWSDDKIKENLLEAQSSKNDYFSNLIALYNEFSEYFYNSLTTQESIGEEKPELIYGLVGNNMEALKALRIYADTTNVTVSDMEEMYFGSGSEDMVKYVKDIYDELESSNNQTIYEYGALKIELAKLISSLYDEYSNVGCIEDSEIIKECLASTVVSESSINNERLFNEYVVELDDVEWHLTNDVISLSNMINRSLNIVGVDNE